MTPQLASLLRFFVFAVVVYGLHYAAIVFYLYWTLPWFDIMMHFLGGALIAYGVYVVGQITKIQLRFVPFVLLVMIVGIGWELFEYSVGLAPLSQYTDTILDLVMDFLGAVLVYCLTRPCA